MRLKYFSLYMTGNSTKQKIALIINEDYELPRTVRLQGTNTVVCSREVRAVCIFSFQRY